MDIGDVIVTAQVSFIVFFVLRFKFYEKIKSKQIKGRDE